jgi:FkbM family methyltransferase
MRSRLHRGATRYARRASRALRLGRVRVETGVCKPGATIRFEGFLIKILDRENAYVMFKDIFENEIYHFHPQTPSPRVLDCGSNVGMSILYFKHLFPQARVTGFEADPGVFKVLTHNMTRNGILGVDLVEAAVSTHDGLGFFAGEHDYDGSLAEYHIAVTADMTREVRTVSLRPWLEEPVDFLKLNIEGAEFDVLSDVADLLPNVSELVIEYHHQPGLPRSLHGILGLLHDAGFEYLLHDFDVRTNAGSHPPFELSGDSRFYLLIYATRI